MGKKKPNPDVEKMTFEQAITALTEVVEQIEAGRIPLAESLDKYERGMALIRRCREILAQAEKRIETIGAEEKAPAPDSEAAKGEASDEDDGGSEPAESADEGLF